jgi:hypothetical protein
MTLLLLHLGTTVDGLLSVSCHWFLSDADSPAHPLVDQEQQ